MASEDTSHGEILSRSEALRTLSRSEAFLALLIRFWLLTLELELPLEVGKGNFDLLLLVTVAILQHLLFNLLNSIFDFRRHLLLRINL